MFLFRSYYNVYSGSWHVVGSEVAEVAVQVLQAIRPTQAWAVAFRLEVPGVLMPQLLHALEHDKAPAETVLKVLVGERFLRHVLKALLLVPSSATHTCRKES